MTAPAPELRYLALRAALARYHQALPELTAAQLTTVYAVAEREYRLQQRVLESPLAHRTTLAESRLQQSLAEIHGRYGGPAELTQDLARNGLDPERLEQALRRELRVEAVLEVVAAGAGPVSDSEVEIFYYLHPEQFSLPETRSARHILVTINPAYPENTRDAARQRLLGVAAKLRQRPSRFAELAQKHSECPTAVNGGVLGRVRPGQLYPELERVLFGLAAGALSPPVESELGFHLLLCEAIHPPQQLSLTQAEPQVRARLQQRHTLQHQRAWLAALPTTESDEAP